MIVNWDRPCEDLHWFELNWRYLWCLKVRDMYIKTKGFFYLHLSAFAGSFKNLIFCNLTLHFSEGIHNTEQVFTKDNIEYW